MSKLDSAQRRNRVFRYVLLSVAALIIVAAIPLTIVWCSAAPMTPQDMIDATHEGDKLIRAVLAFRERHGTIPTSLKELAPEFIAVFPTSKFGNWNILPAIRGRPVHDEFAIVFDIEGELRKWRTDRSELSCYFEPGEIPYWYARPYRRYDTDATVLRRATP